MLTSNSPVGVGVRGMPFAFGTFTGCFISLIFISWFRGHVKWLVFISSVLMTVGCGCLSLARVDNIHAVYGILFIAGLGVGGITVPVSTIATIVCKGEYIATITALTFTVRIVGGAVGYTVYYNVFAHKLVSELKEVLGMECVRLGITNPTLIAQVINLTAASLVKEIRYLPGINENTWAQLVLAGQTAFSNAYPWAYYCSVGFGAVSVLASLFLEDLTEMMDDSVVAMQWANENRESNQQESSS
jgi:Fungal trichothecene efflux pump (TRI12).